MARTGLKRAVLLALCWAVPLIGAPAGAAPPAAIAVAGAWALIDPAEPHLAFVYMTISLPKGHADTLIGATTSLTDTVDLVAPQGPKGHDHMARIAILAVDGAAPLVMQTRGPHLVLHGLAAPLRIGQSFVVTLRFAKAAGVAVPVTVASHTPDLGMPKLPKGVKLD